MDVLCNQLVLLLSHSQPPELLRNVAVLCFIVVFAHLETNYESVLHSCWSSSPYFFFHFYISTPLKMSKIGKVKCVNVYPSRLKYFSNY